jgi:hypothetical protein
MELLFNELSCDIPVVNKYQANDLMLSFSKTVAKARQREFRRIRSDLASNKILLSENYSLHDWMFDSEFPRVNRELLHGMFTRPFIEEGHSDIEDKYLEAEYYFEDIANDISKRNCFGLVSAYLYESLAISLQSSNAWARNKLNLIIERDEELTNVIVYNVFSDECFGTDQISDYLESVLTPVIVETSLNPDDKKFHLTSHHGRKELTELWNLLKKSPYVKEGMSIQWGGKTFYKNPQKNGKLDIVYLKSDRRYAIQIQTTGRNLIETIEIGKLLENQFS